MPRLRRANTAKSQKQLPIVDCGSCFAQPRDSGFDVYQVFAHLASAALRAIALRCSGVIFVIRDFPPAFDVLRMILLRSSAGNPAQRAGPPFLPPNRPSATAWGFFRVFDIRPKCNRQRLRMSMRSAPSKQHQKGVRFPLANRDRSW